MPQPPQRPRRRRAAGEHRRQRAQRVRRAVADRGLRTGGPRHPARDRSSRRGAGARSHLARAAQGGHEGPARSTAVGLSAAPLRTVYLGTSQFAAEILRILAGSPHRPELVVTRPDRPRGRGRKLASPPVLRTALELEIPTDQPDSVNDKAGRGRIAAPAPRPTRLGPPRPPPAAASPPPPPRPSSSAPSAR